MDENLKKTKCSKCKSEDVKIDRNVLTCNFCGFINDKFQIPRQTKKHQIMYKENLKRFPEDLIYPLCNEILTIWYATINQFRGDNDDGLNEIFNKLSANFKNNLEGFFEQLKTKKEFTD
ncbi:MAG: hypothetical protein AABX84_02290 [Nanoarchaeota archaeon]